MNFILKKIRDRRWPLRCLLFLTVACRAKTSNDTSLPFTNGPAKEEQNITAALDTIYSNREMVKQGDLVMRTGRDFTSEIMRQLSLHDKTYSHCGIASFEHDSLFVYHSLGGEWNPDEKVRRDPFDMFCNPFENRGFGIFRYKLSRGEDSQLIKIIKKYYARAVRFDMQFDLASDDRMYCSEFVYKAVQEASDHKIALPVTTINNIRFVAPDNLFINPGCIEIKRVVFNRQ
jgi:hypothetical protein